MLYSSFLLSSQKVAAPSSLKSDPRAVIAAISGVVPTMFMTASDYQPGQRAISVVLDALCSLDGGSRHPPVGRFSMVLPVGAVLKLVREYCAMAARVSPALAPPVSAKTPCAVREEATARHFITRGPVHRGIGPAKRQRL
jgi:hypothetical protein